MKLSYDQEADAIYLKLDENIEVHESEEIKDGIILDYDKDGNVVGIELLGAKGRVRPEQLKQVLVDLAS